MPLHTHTHTLRIPDWPYEQRRDNGKMKNEKRWSQYLIHAKLYEFCHRRRELMRFICDNDKSFERWQRQRDSFCYRCDAVVIRLLWHTIISFSMCDVFIRVIHDECGVCECVGQEAGHVRFASVCDGKNELKKPLNLFINESHFIVLYSKRQSTPASPIRIHLVAMERFATPPKAKGLNWWAKMHAIRSLCFLMVCRWHASQARAVVYVSANQSSITTNSTIPFDCEADRYLSRIQKSSLIPYTSCLHGERLRSHRLFFDKATERERKQQQHSVFTRCANLYFLYPIRGPLCVCLPSPRVLVSLFIRGNFRSHPPTNRRFRMPHSYISHYYFVFSALPLCPSLTPSRRIYFMNAE